MSVRSTITAQPDRRPGKQGRQSQIIRRLNELLQEYLNSERPLQDGPPTPMAVARQLHMSPVQLSHLLLDETGYTAQQHINNTMMERGMDLLARTNNTIRDVAAALGFTQTQAFSKLFKARTGQTPGEYKRFISGIAQY